MKRILMALMGVAVIYGMLACTDYQGSYAEKYESSVVEELPVPNEINSFVDKRDNQSYEIVQIGSQTWFAQNLNYDDGKGKCSADEDSQCGKYGRLYDANSILRVIHIDDSTRKDAFDKINALCPEGWRVPNKSDWKILIDYVANAYGEDEVGKNLKASEGWYKEGKMIQDANNDLHFAVATGNNPYGFSAFPSGICWTSSCDVGADAYFWGIADTVLAKAMLPTMLVGYKLSFENDDFVENSDVNYSNNPRAAIRCIQGEIVDVYVDHSSVVNLDEDVQEEKKLDSNLSVSGEGTDSVETVVSSTSQSMSAGQEDSLMNSASSGKVVLLDDDSTMYSSNIAPSSSSVTASSSSVVQSSSSVAPSSSSVAKSSSSVAPSSSSIAKSSSSVAPSSSSVAKSSSSVVPSSSSVAKSSSSATPSSSSVAKSSSSVMPSSSSVAKSSSSVMPSSSSVADSLSSVTPSSSSVAESSSSVASNAKYDCLKYNCVTTEYLNQEMLAAGKYGELLDTRDNQVYRTIEIGTQTWMAQNLNYASAGGSCYAGDTLNCRTYGRLYYWSAISDSDAENQGTLQGPCFDGWHVPTEEEFLTLIKYVGGEKTAELDREYSSWPAFYSYENSATVLKSANYDWTGGPYSDEYGFSAIPSGNRWDYGKYEGLGKIAVYWTNSVADVYWGPRTLTRRIAEGDYVGAHWDLLDYMYAIRCLKD